MADKQYDVTAEDRRLFEEKQRQRLALREYFIKNTTNPYRHMSNEGGFLFDSGIQRYMAMTFKQYDHFRPSPVSSLYALGLFVVPTAIYGYLMWQERAGRENAIRTGQVAYHDRKFKLI